MPKEYVTYADGAYRIGETRVSLDSLVYLFREGMSAESMVRVLESSCFASRFLYRAR